MLKTWIIREATEQDLTPPSPPFYRGKECGKLPSTDLFNIGEWIIWQKGLTAYILHCVEVNL